MIVADYLEVNLARYEICAIVNLEKDKCYPIAKGKPSTPTPRGTYYVQTIIANQRQVAALYGNHIGSAVIDLGTHPLRKDLFLAIHGTNRPRAIGTSVSLGCIRMLNINVNDLISTYFFNKIIIQ